MKSYVIILILAILVASCDKEDEITFIKKPSDEIVKYEITLENNQIVEYVKFVNDIQSQTTIFQDFDSVVNMIRTNSSNEIIYKKVFYIGDNDLALSATDSSFSDYGLFVTNMDYVYENGFLTYAEMNWKQYGENADSGVVYISNTIENNNIIESTESFPDWTSGCTDYFEFNNQINMVDIRGLTNGDIGAKSNNLVKHATWNSGCPCGPSSSVAYSNFNYDLDENGYVTKMVETYTPCYHLISAVQVVRTVRTTFYEYNFR